MWSVTGSRPSTGEDILYLIFGHNPISVLIISENSCEYLIVFIFCNSKMRRGDKFTESTFLSSPVFKDGKKKRQKKNVTKLKLERPVSVD